MFFRPFILITATLCASATLSAQEPAADSAFFEKQVRPILVQHCYSCHSHAGGKMRGGLALDSRSGWEKGGGAFGDCNGSEGGWMDLAEPIIVRAGEAFVAVPDEPDM